MAALLICLVHVLITALLQQRSEAISYEDATRTLLSYQQGFDTCNHITDSSSDVSKSAADRTCTQAFAALDRLKRNTCKGWRRARCRMVAGLNYRQCSCKISACDDKSIKSDVIKPFRECASALRDHERSLGVTPAQTIDLNRIPSESAHAWSAPSYSDRYGGAGSSSVPFVFTAGEGSSRGVYPSAATSSSSGVQQKYGAVFPVAVWVPPVDQRQHCCHICLKRYTSKGGLNQHLRCHLTDETTCHVCNKVLATKQILKSHMQSHHPGADLRKSSRARGPIINREREPGAHVCRECGKSYAFLSTLREHELSHTTLETHCFDCKITLGSKQSYRYHLQRRHPEEALALEEAENAQYIEQNPEVCGLCKKRFRDSNALHEHKAYHEGKTRCRLCGAMYARMSGLYNHMAKAHPNEKGPLT